MGQGDERGREAVRSGARGGLRAPLPFALAALFAAMPQGAWAQTASQVTPPTYAPPPVRPTETIVLPEGPGVTAPAGAENLDVPLGGIDEIGKPSGEQSRGSDVEQSGEGGPVKKKK